MLPAVKLQARLDTARCDLASQQGEEIMRTIVTDIGEFFTGDMAAPTAPVRSFLIEDGTIRTLDPPVDTPCDRVLDVRGGAVLPGLIDGHVHPVFGEWTPAQDAIGWIGNYLHGGTTTMVSAGELHAPGLDYNHLTPDLVTSLAEVMRATTGRVRWSGVKLHAGTVLLVPGMKEAHFDRLAKAGVAFAKFLFYPLSANPAEAKQYVAWCRERAIRVKVHTGACRAQASARFAATTYWLGFNRTSPPTYREDLYR